MITESTIYWITRLDGIGFILILGALVSTGLAVGVTAMIADNCNANDDEKKLYYGMAKKLGSLALALSIITTLTPSTKEMAMIYVVPKIANTEFVGEAGSRLDDLSELAFDKLESILEIKKGELNVQRERK